MSVQLNLGTAGVNAVQNLRGNPHFEKLVEILGDTTFSMCHAILDISPDTRAEYAAYTRGVRDIWRQFEAATRDVRVNQTGPAKDGKPGKPKTPTEPSTEGDDPLAALSALAGGAPPKPFGQTTVTKG